MICGEPFYRRASYIARGIHKTCGKSECKSESMSGANNPFWGKTHDPEALEKMFKARSARVGPRKRTGPPKGYRHTPEAKAAMTAALKERWAKNRDDMLARFAREPKPREEMRYRRIFTPFQKREWQGDKCAWCSATDELVLDHVIPIMCGGENERANAQTLCQPCNMWKMVHVDRPLFLAGLGKQRGY